MPHKWNQVHPRDKDQSSFQKESQQNPSFEKTRLATVQHPEPAIDGPIDLQHCQESDVQKAIHWFAEYLRSEREQYYAIGESLPGDWRELMDGYFAPGLLDQVRIVKLVDERIANPWFYSKARERGLHHLPDMTHKAAATFLDVVVFNQKIGSRDLFHGLVHAAQMKVLGMTQFTQLFVRGFLRARSYFLVPMKAHAFALDARFAAHPGVRFSVEHEIRQWWQAGKY